MTSKNDANNHECIIGKCQIEAIERKVIEFANNFRSSDERAFFRKVLEELLTEQKEAIKDLIVEEIGIARSENIPTSRLTSLFNKISELK